VLSQPGESLVGDVRPQRGVGLGLLEAKTTDEACDPRPVRSWKLAGELLQSGDGNIAVAPFAKGIRMS
jgi:hypothetical protein